jgi:hypothetical protein
MLEDVATGMLRKKVKDDALPMQSIGARFLCGA